jgi:hypothetical protein
VGVRVAVGGRGVRVGVGGGGVEVDVREGSTVGLGGAVSTAVVVTGPQALIITSRPRKISETEGEFLRFIFKRCSPGGQTRAIIIEVDPDDPFGWIAAGLTRLSI